jgi:hypothetical protein
VAFANLFSNVAARLFGAAPAGANSAVEPELVHIGVEAIVDAVDPRLRTISGYDSKIAPGVACTITHMRALARDLPEPIALSRGAWGSDPLLNALFATAADVPNVLGSSAELRAYFESPAAAGAAEAYALLGMVKSERNVLAPAIVNGVLRQDVAQTTVSFSNHRLIAPAADLLGCRREVGTRILRRLAAIALERITAMGERANELGHRKAMLGARLRLLNLRQSDMEEMVSAAGDVAGEIAAIERELKATVDDYVETKASLATLESRLAHVNAVFGAPAEHVRLECIKMRVNKMGYKVGPEADEPASDLALRELSIGAGLKAVILFVRCARSELPPKETLSARGAREML